MSKFIEDLKKELNLYNFGAIDRAKENIDSLGDNARKMLDIGIVMDDLAALGFKHKVHSSKFNIIEIDCMQLLLPESHSRFLIEVRFTKDYAYLPQTNERFFFTVENWKQDLLSKVKELIRDEK